MEVLVVGDLFVPSEAFREAVEKEMGSDFGPIREISWSGESQEAQHHVQQVMEKEGPEAAPTPEEIVEAIGEAEIIAVHFAPVSEAVLVAGKNLNAVIVARAGFENVYVEAADRLGIAVVNLRGRNASAVAEEAIGLMLAESRDIARADAGIKGGRWPKEFSGPVYEIGGRTIGVIGFGEVARQLAKKLSGFDVEMLVYDPYVDAEVIESYGGEKVEDLERVFREGDFVNLHARLTDETRRFIGREYFEMMKPSAYFINNARSRMVNYEDLYEALEGGRIAGAALDVHEDEPLPEDSPWRTLENVTLTPHVAGATIDTGENTVRMVAEAIKEFAENGRCENTVNAAALEGVEKA